MFLRRYAEPDTDLPFTVDPRAIDALVGALALTLPLVLGLSVWLFASTCFPASISHFYYTRLGGDILVGALNVIGVVMIFFYRYRGRGQTTQVAHSGPNALLAKLAGFSALGVAYVPTNGLGCAYDGSPVSRFLLTGTGPGTAASGVVSGLTSDDFWGTFAIWATPEQVPVVLANLHYLSAALMFAILGYFSFFVFTRVQTRAAPADTTNKRRRNLIYRIMGILIFAAIAALAVKLGLVTWLLAPARAAAFLAWWDGLYLTFVFESVALVAFGISWAVKGRLFGLDDPPEGSQAV